LNHASDAVPLASGIRQLFATCSLHPFSNSRLLPFARPSASSISATGHFPTFVVCDRPLLDWNSRPRLASEPILRPALLRRDCGSQPTVSGIHLLAKISALKLRLERFRPRLEFPVPKGGVSLTTPRTPKGSFHSLPLTLSIKTENTVTPCSAAGIIQCCCAAHTRIAYSRYR
jgi:hypothetical protein